jgi:hypothetical protein
MQFLRFSLRLGKLYDVPMKATRRTASCEREPVPMRVICKRADSRGTLYMTEDSGATRRKGRIETQTEQIHWCHLRLLDSQWRFVF